MDNFAYICTDKTLFNMIDYKEIHKKPYHFTLERLDPEDERVPEAIIPDDMNLHFTADEMLTLRRFYKERGRDVEFEEFEGYDEDSYEEDCELLLQYLYLCTSKEMQDYAAAHPMTDLGIYTYQLSQKLPYNLDDYWICPPDELIDNVLDDKFMDWVGIMNEQDLQNALFDATADMDLPKGNN